MKNENGDEDGEGESENKDEEDEESMEFSGKQSWELEPPYSIEDEESST